MPCQSVFGPDSAYFFTFDDLASFSSIATHSTGDYLSVFFTFVPNSTIWTLENMIQNDGKVRVAESAGVASRLPRRIGGLARLAVRLGHLLGRGRQIHGRGLEAAVPHLLLHDW